MDQDGEAATRKAVDDGAHEFGGGIEDRHSVMRKFGVHKRRSVIRAARAHRVL
ncbi:hypothetical protein [Saccharopolyspora karakumensis]|uniref:hypothetical protein n=1 Tax=Saccharopolyspora karakumensis TaxID=2530386 RepID=UPI0014045E9E|nr:hypothetical protein [Saccharopolyspora karakumensis]